MAEKALTVSEALKKLEQQLTCTVCLERYTQPRTLPCLHSFCHDCLGHFPVSVQGGKHLVSCPNCRQTTQLPDKGVSGFQSAFLINSFLELHQLLEKVSGSQQISCENCPKEPATGYCKQCSAFYCQACIDTHSRWKAFAGHQIMGVEDVAATASKLVPLKEQPTMECPSHNKPLEVYCDTCDQLICQVCTIKQHRDHECDIITDAFPRHHQQIVDSLQPVKQKLAAIAATVKTFESQKVDILKQGQAVKREIQAIVQQLIQVLQESERQLLREVDTVTDAYVEKVSARQKEADIAIAQLKNCEEFAEEELRIGSQQQILVMKRQMVERMRAVCLQVKEDSLQPLEETKLRFVKSTSTLEACCSLGSVVDCSKLKREIACHEAIAGRKAILELADIGTPLSPDLLSCQLSPAVFPTVAIRCNMRQVTAGKVEVSYCPFTAGPHQLRMQVGGANISDSPFTVEVMPRQAGLTFSGLSHPWGVAITKEGHLVVVECDKSCVTIFSTTSGRKIRSFGSKGSGQEQFSSPFGVAVTQGNYVVVGDGDNHRIQVLTAEGAFIAEVGSSGSQQLQFLCPGYIAAHPNGKLFVTDYGNNHVQVLNSNLNFSHCFGRKGSQPGEFNYPVGIAIDTFGMVYIADSGNSRVQKFTPEGNFVDIIGRRGQLSSPRGLCIDSNDIIYVTDDDSVSMFTTSGQFLGYVGDGGFKSPQNITVDPSSGKLFISCDDKVITY